MINLVSKEEYRLAIDQLLALAQGDSSENRTAAQLLLSTYDGGNFQLSVTELCDLDREYFPAAITVIRGRRDTGIEPQLLIENGEQQFKDLCNRWERLHLSNRAKPSCPGCFGSGRAPEFPDDVNNYSEVVCPVCGGKGF